MNGSASDLWSMPGNLPNAEERKLHCFKSRKQKKNVRGNMAFVWCKRRSVPWFWQYSGIIVHLDTKVVLTDLRHNFGFSQTRSGNFNSHQRNETDFLFWSNEVLIYEYTGNSISTERKWCFKIYWDYLPAGLYGATLKIHGRMQMITITEAKDGCLKLMLPLG